MYLEALLLGAIIGWMRKGRLAHFFGYAFKGRYMALVALLVFVMPFFLYRMDVHIKYALLPYLAMVICAMIALVNYKTLGMKLLFLGMVVNLVVMGFNDFAMPIDTVKMAEIGGKSFVDAVEAGDILNYRPLVGSAGISAFLGKVVALPKFYPFPVMLSFGDILASLGIVLVVQHSMLINRKGDMIQFSYRRW